MSLHLIYDSGLLRLSLESGQDEKVARTSSVAAYLKESSTDVKEKLMTAGYDSGWPTRSAAGRQDCFKGDRGGLIWVVGPLEDYARALGRTCYVKVTSFQTDVGDARSVLAEFLDLVQRVADIDWPSVQFEGMNLNLEGYKLRSLGAQG